MTQFFMSYWWLMLVALGIILIITRNIVKILISIVIIEILMFLFWQIFVSSSFYKSNQCFVESSNNDMIVFQEAKQIEVKDEQIKYLCGKWTEGFNRLVNCLDSSRRENKFGFIIYSNFPKFRENIKETVMQHNTVCNDSLLTIPTFTD